MKTSKKTLILLATAVVFALAASGLYAFLFVTIKNKTEATSTLVEKIDEISGKESRLASSVSLLKRENADIEKVSALFFKENEVVNFTKNIEELGAQSGTVLTIESLERGSTEKATPFLSFRIKVIGEFSDIARLLMLLENFPGKFEWKTVRITRDSSTTTDEPAVVGKVPAKVALKDPQWRVDAFLVALNFTNQ